MLRASRISTISTMFAVKFGKKSILGFGNGCFPTLKPFFFDPKIRRHGLVGAHVFCPPREIGLTAIWVCLKMVCTVYLKMAVLDKWWATFIYQHFMWYPWAHISDFGPRGAQWFCPCSPHQRCCKSPWRHQNRTADWDGWKTAPMTHPLRPRIFSFHPRFFGTFPVKSQLTLPGTSSPAQLGSRCFCKMNKGRWNWTTPAGFQLFFSPKQT